MSYVVGVDLGTTYTAAAVVRDGRVEVVELGDRVASVASVLWFRDDHGLVVGEAAVRRAESEPGRVAREFKRRFGDPVPIMVAGTPISADALTARLLRWVVDEVVEQEGGEPAVVGVAHPANWGPYKLDLLAQAVRLAGVTQTTFVSEPHAAAESHASAARVAGGDVVVVYDLGGGTFDAAVLQRSDEGFELLGAEGIERLGGIDFDEAVFNHVRQALGPDLAALDQHEPVVAQALARLRDDCARAKEALSSDTEVSIPVALPAVHTTVRLTRGEFEDMIRPIVASTIDTVSRAISSAGLTPAGVSKVLLVGGSSRIPLVSLMISTELGCPVALDTHPKHAVAMGLARLAAQGPAAVDSAGHQDSAGVGARAGAGAGGSPIPPPPMPTANSAQTEHTAEPPDSPGLPYSAGPSSAPAAADIAATDPLTLPDPGAAEEVRPAAETRQAAGWTDDRVGAPALPPQRDDRPRPSRVKRLVVAALLVIVAAGLATVLLDSFKPAAAEVFLEPRDAPVPDPFTPDVADPGNPTTVPSPDLGRTDGQVLSMRGGDVGLYGGANSTRICDKDQLAAFLARDDTKAAAWAGVLDIQPAGIDGYIEGLTPALLQTDTRMTNHGYRDGAATPRQAVLQAGTAVLLDRYGVPRVKCGCGNPLTDAARISNPHFTGASWAGFDRSSLSRVVPAERRVDRFVLRDVHTGMATSRPVGSDGERDVQYQNPLPSPGAPGSEPSVQPELSGEPEPSVQPESSVQPEPSVQPESSVQPEPS
ncbi:MAG: DUF6777 domain-containing protein, partial [Pseudonocardiaceae bacterium]